MLPAAVDTAAASSEAHSGVAKAQLWPEVATHAHTSCVLLLSTAQTQSLLAVAAPVATGSTQSQQSCSTNEVIEAFLVLANDVPGRATPQLWHVLATAALAVAAQHGGSAWQNLQAVACALVPHVVTEVCACLESAIQSAGNHGTASCDNVGAVLVRVQLLSGTCKVAVCITQHGMSGLILQSLRSWAANEVGDVKDRAALLRRYRGAIS